MGCAQSGIGDESISRCKQRKLLLNQALAYRTAFTASHSAYAAALVATGLALRRYAHGEAENPEISILVLPEMDCIPNSRDDAVLEESGKAREIKLKRGVSKKDSVFIPKDDAVLEELVTAEQKHGVSKMDSVSILKNDDVSKKPVKIWDFFSSMNTLEEEEEDDEDEELVFRTPDNASTMEDVVDNEEEEAEVPLPKQVMNSKTATAEARRASNVNWLEALEEITGQFSKASECAQEVSRLLVPNRYRFCRNVADFRVTVDLAARVLHVITWNQPDDAGNRNNGLSAGGNEPHAVVLDKLLAWEKKLYAEMKASELVKRKYQRKVMLLAQQKKCGASAESLEKTKAAVSHVHTRYIVDLQLMDSTVSEVNIIRDCQLYPKLVELVDRMANMWENMSTHHDNQLRTVTDLKSVDISAVPGETTWDQYEKTTKFLTAVEGWQTQFEKLVAHQKNYVSALNSWLKLSLIPIRSSLKEKLSSSSRIPNPPIQPLLFSWHECIDKLPNEPVKTTIFSFAATIKTIILLQEKEMKLKEKCEETRKEYLRKNQAFDEWLHKHKHSARTDTVDEHEAGDEAMVDKDLVSERRSIVESLKKQLDQETEDHRKHCLRVREKSIRSLRMWLPKIFRAMSDYAHACADTYNRVACITLSENPTNVNDDPS